MSKLPNSNRETEDRPPSTPRWVKVSGIIAIVLFLLVIIIMFISGGNHGPGRHIPMNKSAEQIGQEPIDKQALADVVHESTGDDHF